ncbi:DoxX family protein [Mycolicibacterium thermoresistibile]|uniref:DoxX-like family protein n=2 Tax=Mycolicibacterium thermoresistibile TaxID=1797 RepID=G7CAQ5_MYCT3|nr:DoxX family protein [Mycolicibacterium thermoresistibile]EHI14935.1 hypothetical protein KEK_00235 [Mycolicibacterium thermoresistibile ATCC 19527]MCV7188514.1 DoxX family protein [Mycolicibacterium thermoresistibile]GAT17398.1 membrane protease subunit [Mycolicibacterium thermoresistibile]SNW18155.1 Uncharacterised protein [Mycolicibacterium thermoresistibile]
MTALTSPRTYTALAVFQAADAVACAIPAPPIGRALDTLGVPQRIRWVLPASKAASAVGLLAVRRFPGLARLTTAMLTLYFVLAVGAHVRVRDKPYNAVPAVTFLLTYAAMTIKGPRS